MRAAEPVRLACFDLDNTLIDRQGAYVAWAKSFAEARGLDPDAVQLLCELDDDGFASRAEVFGPAREALGLPESVEELIAAYRLDYPRFVQPVPDVVAGLAVLSSAGWLLALVTNGPLSQREKLERSGLADSFDAICISDELGVAKPNPEIFREAARCAGTSLEAARGTGWMVGDSRSSDIGGGRAAGLRTVWMRRDREWDLDWYRPDRSVDSLHGALEVILSSDPVIPAGH